MRIRRVEIVLDDEDKLDKYLPHRVQELIKTFSTNPEWEDRNHEVVALYHNEADGTSYLILGFDERNSDENPED